MILPVQLAQGRGPDSDWGQLLWLLVLVVLPVINAIKDWYVRRAENAKQEQTGPGQRQPRSVPRLRPVEPKLPPARAWEPESAPRPLSEVGPAPAAKPVAAPAPIARQATPRPAPTAAPPLRSPRPQPAPPAKVTLKTNPALPASGGAPRPRRESVAGVAIETAAPSVDVHAADPTIKVRREKKAVDVSTGRPAVRVHDIVTAEVLEAIRTRTDILGVRLTPVEMRRAVVLSEILGLPLALRGAGGWAPGMF